MKPGPNSFAALGLQPALLATLDGLGYHTPTPVQQKAIPAVLAGQDLIASAQTGTGKTAAFALPLLQRLAAEPAAAAGLVRALVLVPTRELAEQVCASFAAYGAGVEVSVYAAYGGVSLAPQMTRLAEGVDILVATPGRLIDLFTKGAVKLRAVSAVVLDEADRLLDLGFAADLDVVFQAVPRQRQTLLFSATFPDAVRELGRNRLRKPVTVEAAPRNSAAKQVRQRVVPVDKKRKGDLFLFMWRDYGWQQALVFAKTKKGVDELVARLQTRGIAADALHGDRPQATRKQVLADFAAGQLQVLVATDVAARGIDIDGLPLVVNFDLPLQAEDYVHRIGRTGRAGAAGEAVSFVCADEAPQLAAIEQMLKKSLSRDEEPGFEPQHRVPPTGPGAVAKARPAAPAKKPGSGRGGVPGNWEGFGASPGPRPARGSGRRTGR